jgi:riboflavin kinase/FMN adenylyltransferase
MKHLRKLEPIQEAEIWVTIGAFDGVHLGHQKIIRTMVNKAKLKNIKTGVITFYPHPAVVVRQLKDAFYLTSPDEKSEIFNDLGVDYTITIPFDYDFSKLTPEEFIQKLLLNFPVSQFWIGNDFSFGKNRTGNTIVLEQLGVHFGFKTIISDHVTQDSEKISSSKIRKWVLAGEMELATQSLGRPYSLTGDVIHGDERGRKIGFPTANLSVWEEKILPPAGVYATLAVIEKQVFYSVTNVGFRPTFKDNQIKPQVETYLHHFNRSIYDQPVQLFFIKRIRPEIKFESISAITAQITQDVQKSEEILRHAEKQTSLFIRSTTINP